MYNLLNIVTFKYTQGKAYNAVLQVLIYRGSSEMIFLQKVNVNCINKFSSREHFCTEVTSSNLLTHRKKDPSIILIRLTVCSFRIMHICNFGYYPFRFQGQYFGFDYSSALV